MRESYVWGAWQVNESEGIYVCDAECRLFSQLEEGNLDPAANSGSEQLSSSKVMVRAPSIPFSGRRYINAERHVILAEESQLAASGVVVKVGDSWRIRGARRRIGSKRPAYALIVADRIASHRERSKGCGCRDSHTAGATGPHSQFVLRSVRVEVQDHPTVITRRQNVLDVNLVSILVITSAGQFDILPVVAGRRTHWLRAVDCLVGSDVHSADGLSGTALTVKVKAQHSAGDVSS